MFSSAFRFFKDLYKQRNFILDLAVRDFTSGYHGSVLGITWAFVEPTIYILIMWVFFTKAIKYQPNLDHPYLVWLMCGMIMWTFISSAMGGATKIFKEHSYLMKRWNFNMAILPVSHIISMLFLHFIFLGLLIILMLGKGVEFSLWWFQAVYYVFASSVFLLGFSWLVGTLSIFLKDVSNIINVFLQFGFWVSPIFWDINTYPAGFRFLLKLNPLYHIVLGYRNCFLFQEGFWVDTQSFIYFWSFTIIMSATGYISYRKLRPHFADVL